ncbi:unnamed protein product [Pleuronectes platessa]|uniref:Uncharacterized protein n=1 Tax=Pleuronectes platessa TaxID=8262 RepID=A0A9N7W293_PLEPL|nr:unnamed protein product [Pleuronectes platessa]
MQSLGNQQHQHHQQQQQQQQQHPVRAVVEPEPTFLIYVSCWSPPGGFKSLWWPPLWTQPQPRTRTLYREAPGRCESRTGTRATSRSILTQQPEDASASTVAAPGFVSGIIRRGFKSTESPLRTRACTIFPPGLLRGFRYKTRRSASVREEIR